MNELKARASANSPGSLSGSWDARLTGEGFIVGNTSDHAAFPEFGTGLYGPKHDFIRAKPNNRAGGYMVFYINGRKIVTKQVKGQTQQRFLYKAAVSMFGTENVKHSYGSVFL